MSISFLGLGQSRGHFDYDLSCGEIYQSIIDFRLDDAENRLSQAFNVDPNNLSYLHLSSYKDFFELFITEDEHLLKASQKRQEKSIQRLKKELQDDNPYKRFAIAEIYLHSAIIRSKFGQMLRSAREILKAYDLLKENEVLFPDFIYNKKSLSVIHSLAETVSMPGIVKRAFGIEGSIAQGIEEIESVIHYSRTHEDFLFKEEIDAIYLYILMYQANAQEQAISYLDKSRLDTKQSLLSTFLVAKMLQRYGNNDGAISILEQRPRGSGYAAFDYLYLMEGTCRLRQLDKRGVALIDSFINNFQGRHFIKEAHQKLGWASLVFSDNLAGYKYHMSLAKTQGHNLVDDDKQALLESKQSQVPDPILLRARLLSDGGYHEQAYVMLVQKAYLYTQETDRRSLEFNYRMGRISHALKNYPEALEYYNQTIKKGKTLPMYFACNAALQAGLISEAIGKPDLAETYYSECLSIHPDEYKVSLHQKARSGMMRVADK